MKKLLLISMAAILLSGCASVENYRLATRSWTGANVNDLVASWGPPSSQYKTPGNGGRHHYILYSYRQVGTNPTYTTGGTTTVETHDGNTYVRTEPLRTSGGGTFFRNCKTWFMYNKQNIIQGSNFRGNSCAITKSQGRGMVNPRKAYLFK